MALDTEQPKQGGQEGEHDSIPGGLRPDETAKLDQMEAGLRDGSNDSFLNRDRSGDLGGGRPSFASRAGSALASRLKGAGQFLNRHKKGAAGVGGGGLLALILSLMLSGPFFVEHMFQNEFKHVRQDVSRIEQKEANKILQRVLKKALCKQGATAKVCTKSSSGPLEDEVNKIDPKEFDDRLKANGFEATYDAEGNISSLKDTKTGTTYDENAIADDNFLSDNPDIADRLSTAFPEVDVGDLTSYRSLMDFHSNVSFRYYPDDPTKDGTNKEGLNEMQQTDEEKTTQGATAEENSYAASEATDENPPADQTGTQQQQAQSQSDYNQKEGTTGAIENAVNATTEEFNKTSLVQDAVNKGVDAFQSEAAGKALFVTGIATLLCQTRSDIVKVADARVFTLIKFLIRHGNILLTMDSQMREGKLTGKEFNDTMMIFQGDPNAKPTKNPKTGQMEPAEASLPFSASAGWQRATGQPVTGPDLSPAANPNRDSTKQLVDRINNDIGNIPGVNFSCSVLTSKAGGFLQGVLGIGQLILSIPSFGADDAAILAANTAVIQGFEHFILPDILKMLSNIAVTGTEDAVQFFNNSDAGLILSTNDYARRMGGRPMHVAEQQAVHAKTVAMETAAEQRKPLTQQLFAISDTDSLLSRLIVSMPLSLQSFIGEIQNAPNLVMASIFPAVHADSSASSCGGDAQLNPYCFTMYNFTDQEVDKYGPFENESVLRSATVMLPTGPHTSAPYKIIDIFGDPMKYQDSPQGDTNTDYCTDSSHCYADVLHCFVNSTGDSSTNTGIYYSDGDPGDNSSDAHYSFGEGGKHDCGSYGELVPPSSNKTTQYDNANTFQDPNLNDIACHYQINHYQWQDTNPCSPNIDPEMLTRYRQYIMDAHAARDYLEMTTPGALNQ